MSVRHLEALADELIAGAPVALDSVDLAALADALERRKNPLGWLLALQLRALVEHLPPGALEVGPWELGLAQTRGPWLTVLGFGVVYEVGPEYVTQLTTDEHGGDVLRLFHRGREIDGS